MSEIHPQVLDPRIQRTRQLLHESLQKLLETKDFDKISVQEIAEAATLNRATFYDHYPDKVSLLQCTVGMKFQELLSCRNITFDGTCASALKAVVLAVCDFIGATPGMNYEAERKIDPHMETAVISVIRYTLLNGLKEHPSNHGVTNAVTPEMLAATLSSAIYGASKEWILTPNRLPSEAIASKIVTLLSPLL
jgi:AcrR family transcriptional regulator